MLRSSFILSPTAYSQLNLLYETTCRDKFKSFCQIPSIFPDGAKLEHFLGSLIGSALFLFEDLQCSDSKYTVKADNDEAVAYLKESQFLVFSFWMRASANMTMCQVVNIRLPSIDIYSSSPLTDGDDILMVAKRSFEDLSKALAYKISELYEQGKENKVNFAEMWRENADGNVQSDSESL